MNKKEKMYQEIEQHGKNLLAIFPTAAIQNPVQLSKRLFSLESRATRLTTDECNTGNNHDDELDAILGKIVNILNPTPEQQAAIFINTDPRGYALKIRDDYARNLQIFRDWGGYGILAPNFSE